MNFGEKIKEKRQPHHFSQRQLAEKINVSPRMIGSLSTGFVSEAPLQLLEATKALLAEHQLPIQEEFKFILELMQISLTSLEERT